MNIRHTGRRAWIAEHAIINQLQNLRPRAVFVHGLVLRSRKHKAGIRNQEGVPRRVPVKYGQLSRAITGLPFGSDRKFVGIYSPDRMWHIPLREGFGYERVEVVGYDRLPTALGDGLGLGSPSNRVRVPIPRSPGGPRRALWLANTGFGLRSGTAPDRRDRNRAGRPASGFRRLWKRP